MQIVGDTILQSLMLCLAYILYVMRLVSGIIFFIIIIVVNFIER